MSVLLKRIFQISILVLLLSAIVVLYVGSKEVQVEPDTKEAYYEQFKRDYKIFSPPLPEKMDFCGEEVPLNRFDIAEQLDREILVNTYWHSNALLLFKRAHRWFPVIEPILKEQGVPDDFKYLAVIESGLMQTTSPAGAKGFWQFMRATGRSYGLEINDEVDERYHVIKSTRAACKYLKDAYKSYGSWTNAAASYNVGMGGLNKQFSRQNEDNYYDVSLNSETGRYLFRILAVKAIFSKPSKYGFNLRETDLYPRLSIETEVVDTTIADLASFAHDRSISYKMLKELNPWLLTNYLPNKSRKKYEIWLPKKEMLDYSALRKKMSMERGIFGDKK